MSTKPVALITGASRGIGAATAVTFAQRGYRTALVARSRQELEATAQAVSDAGSEAIVCAGDLADLAFAESAVTQTLQAWGRIDALVNNAAWRELVTMRTITLESWEKTLRICLTAPAFLARWAAADMEKRGRGAIINISSVMSQQAAGFGPAYIASKGGLDALTYDLAALYGPKGIRVVAVNPGAIDTDMSADYTSAEGESLSRDIRQWGEDMIPLRRWGTPQEIANVIVWLASDEASYISGTTIFADGGWRHQHMLYNLKHRQFPEEFP